MPNDLNNRNRQRNIPPSNYNNPARRQSAAPRPNNSRPRQDASRAGQTQRRPQNNMPISRPPQGMRRTENTLQKPQRPPMSKNQKTSENQAAIAPNTQRNLRLAAILLILVALCVIVFGIQSCSKKDRTSGDGSARDSVQLNTPKPSDSSDTYLPVLAQYTDSSAELTIDSGYGVLIDLDKNEVIASKNADDKIYPASMTKMMTLIVAMENIADLEDTFTFTSEIIDPLYAQNASVAGFSPGETVPLKDIIYGCILPSGADCTTALAIYVAGSEEEFAKMMNEKAAELGLKSTHFVTASGLHNDDHYSTCREMAVILQYAIKNDAMRNVLSTYRYTTTSTAQHPDGITVTSTLFSRMSGDEADGVFVQGGKTGYTLEGKNCLATFAANCTESTASTARPQYILVTAFASGEYTPVFDAINTYKKYCSDTAN